MFVYQADTYCDRCGENMADELAPEVEDTGDTDDFPQYASDGEADCPNHCSDCEELIHEIRPTPTGRRYVADRLVAGEVSADLEDEWAEWADLPLEDHWDMEAVRAYAEHHGDAVLALENFEDAYRGQWDSVEDYAHELAEDCGYLSQMPDAIRHYFDAEAFGRDMELSGDIIAADVGFRRVHIFDAHV